MASVRHNPTDENSEHEYQTIDRLIEDNLFRELSEFVAIQTYRGGALSEDQVVNHLGQIRDSLTAQVEEFNLGQKVHKLELFEWKQPVGHEYWLFGFRLGSGAHKIAVCCHLDTVPPGDDSSWSPFELMREQRDYMGKAAQDFYVGRGSIDDKGPAVVAFNVLKAVARKYDGSDKLDAITVEVIFDTSEETDMAMPHYLQAVPEDNPDFGIIFDASWSVRAEKGIERPKFTVARNSGSGVSMWIDQLNTPEGPSNQIPEFAKAVIRGDSAAELAVLAESVDVMYAEYSFDDPDYRRAEMAVDFDVASRSLTLQTAVAGAQHGSAPQENRSSGANPVASLANFLAGLVDQGKLASNEIGEMCRFLAWGWGTKVFGEHHPELLLRDDEVFETGNGTTYAATRLYTRPDLVQMELDIRYAIGHHSHPWDGSEGMLQGESSIFSEVFGQLTVDFNASASHLVAMETSTAAPPDIRLPENESFSTVANAYMRVMGEPTPARAIGGGTDAKGHNTLIAAGALFTNELGPPINFHGINEGAPVEDLKNGARIIYRLFVDQIEGR